MGLMILLALGPALARREFFKPMHFRFGNPGLEETQDRKN